MSTQYNSIQRPYDYIRTVSIALIERENVADALRPFIQNARVLELACGSGFYTYSFLRWGARSVTGVDISPIMIEEAKQQRPADLASVAPSGTGTEGRVADPVNFIVADCSRPMLYEGGPFDLVFGAWLLNYAPDRPSLLEMFTNISRNLRPGGRFVGVTIPPTNDPAVHIQAEREARPRSEGGSGLLFYEALEDVTDGVYFRVWGDTPVGDFHFDNYLLKAELYEQCAKEAGLRGEWTWGVTSVPERYLQGRGEGGSSLKELESYRTVPTYGILVAEKSVDAD